MNNLKNIVNFSFQLSLVDISNSFRRSYIGIFWISLTALAYIFCIGFMFPYFFSGNLVESIFHVSYGIIFWFFFSITLRESCDTFPLNQGLIFSQNISYMVYILQIFFKNTIVFLVNILFLIIFIIVFDININLLYFGLSIIIFFLITFSLAIIFSIVSTRYKDFSSMIGLMLQLGFILSPIIWNEKILGENTWILKYNFFYHIISLVKFSFFQINYFIILMNILYLIFFMLLDFWLYKFKSKRVPFWI